MTALSLAARRVAEKFGADPDVRELLAEVAQDEPADKATRDSLLREAAATFWPDAKPATAAGHLCRALRRYSTSAWRKDQFEDAPPTDRRNAMLWRILKTSPSILSIRQTRKILAFDHGKGQKHRAG